MGNKKLAFVGMANLDRHSSLKGIGSSIDLTNPELAVSVKELADQMDVSELSVEELITAMPEDQQAIATPEDPPRFMAFDPSQNPVICLQEKFATHLSGCSCSFPISIVSSTSQKSEEKISSMDFDKFLQFSGIEESGFLTNRDKLIPRNFSHRQFQKCRR